MILDSTLASSQRLFLEMQHDHVFIFVLKNN